MGDEWRLRLAFTGHSSHWVFQCFPFFRITLFAPQERRSSLGLTCLGCGVQRHNNKLSHRSESSAGLSRGDSEHRRRRA